MCTSDINGRRVVRAGYVWLIIAAVCAVFGRVYEHFSHEVFSYPMMYAFLYPLLGGALPLLTLALCRPRRLPGRAALWCLSAGLATLTVGSLLTGALAIYGTANRLVEIYRLVGWPLTAAGVVTGLVTMLRREPLRGRHSAPEREEPPRP